MRLLKILIMLAFVLVFSASAKGAVIFNGPVTNVSGNDPGHVQFPTSEAAVSFRPQSASQKVLNVANYYIHDLINQKGLDIRATRHDDGTPAWAYQTITLNNLKISNVERREDLPGGNGLHIDHIRISGGANSQDTKTNLLIENLEIDGGDALPILITDGLYGTVILRNITIKNTTLNNIQFKTDKVGSVDKIIIDNSPGLGVALIGRPGSVGEVLVRNSPNVRLGDSLNASGRTGAVVSYIDAASGSSDASLSPFLVVKPAVSGSVPFTPVISPAPSVSPIPEPGTLGIVAIGLPFLLMRKR